MNEYLLFLVVVAAVVLCLNTTVFFFRNSVISPLSEGEGDLTIRMPEETRNEIEFMSSDFNRFIEFMSTMVMDIRESAEQLQDSLIQRLPDSLRSAKGRRREKKAPPSARFP